MSEIKFSDGMPERARRSSTSIYPEELMDKKCGGCMRCQSRKRKGETGYHCTAVHQRHFTRRQSLCHLLGQRRGREVQGFNRARRRKPQKRTLEYLFKARADKTPNHK